ncbi:MAG TPA: tRNA (adenosine(37)-N6)-dimethylallyltransferase MiaA [Myxococcota bacterium]|nr:tRNA (adenosine(37)-N6)-dimethylallyltransferase MiaA [Myxococcota bacterium]HRY92765.1 tRNA (adenosine(37)-N6)-dimethylallyltransferase MiaA [Myxococcota bacterium]
MAEEEKYDLLVVLGPTASGKTRLGVALARALGGEILSADSRQVYRGLDLGTGKDLAEYRQGGPPVPYQLIDVAGLGEEYSVFRFQRDFFRALGEVRARGRLPVLVGGTGLYLEAVLEGYALVEVPEDPALRRELEGLSLDELQDRLAGLKRLHNVSDFKSRERLVRAIEVAEGQARAQGAGARPAWPALHPLVLGTRWPREELRARIRARLAERLAAGMLGEADRLLASGVSHARLRELGLEYRWMSRHRQGELGLEAMQAGLARAIAEFARRQESWFRRMERRGTPIHWIERAEPAEALEVVRREGRLTP